MYRWPNMLDEFTYINPAYYEIENYTLPLEEIPEDFFIDRITVALVIDSRIGAQLHQMADQNAC